MGFNYAVIGAGRQGTSAAYDLAKNGDSEKILLIDNDLEAALRSAEHVNSLIDKQICLPAVVDVTNSEKLTKMLDDIDSVISAVPYYFNLEITKAAIASKTNYVDMGGNTEVVQSQLALNEEAEGSGVTIIPDCGMGPGMNVSLLMYAISLLDEAEIGKIYVGGLPQNPVPPFGYKLLFHPNGLTNEYYGKAVILRNGEIDYVDTFDEIENIKFANPIGNLEAAFTSGGLSTSPYTLKGKLKTLEYKTLRYPGHWEKFKAFKELGLFEEDEIEFNGLKIKPRDFYHKLLTDVLGEDCKEDLGIMRMIAIGKKDGVDTEVIVSLIDKYSSELDFTSMQRLTGWHCSIIAINAAKGNLNKGATPIETVSGKLVYDELIKRKFNIEVEIKN